MNKTVGLYRDEMAKFLIKNKKLISKDSIVLRIKFPMLPGNWGEDFVPWDQYPKSFCVMVGKDGLACKPYTPIDFTEEYMDLLIKMYPEGKVSRNLFDLKEGDTIFMKGPREKFKIENLNLFNHDHDHEHEQTKIKRIFMFAGGTGISPMFQVLKYLITNQTNIYCPKIILTYCNKSRRDVLLEDELEDLKRLYPKPRMEIRHILEDQRGYITEADVEESNGLDDYVLVCGPKAFNEFFVGNGNGSGNGNDNVGVLRRKLFNSNQIFKF